MTSSYFNLLYYFTAADMGLSLVPDFEAAVVGDMSEQLQALVLEHDSWLRTNCKRQVHFPPPLLTRVLCLSRSYRTLCSFTKHASLGLNIYPSVYVVIETCDLRFSDHRMAGSSNI